MSYIKTICFTSHSPAEYQCIHGKKKLKKFINLNENKNIRSCKFAHKHFIIIIIITSRKCLQLIHSALFFCVFKLLKDDILNNYSLITYSMIIRCTMIEMFVENACFKSKNCTQCFFLVHFMDIMLTVFHLYTQKSFTGYIQLTSFAIYFFFFSYSIICDCMVKLCVGHLKLAFIDNEAFTFKIYSQLLSLIELYDQVNIVIPILWSESTWGKKTTKYLFRFSYLCYFFSTIRKR